jgi:hypothetical protein
LEAREVFWNIGTQQKIMFYVIGTAAILVFVYGFYRHIAKYARGRSLAAPALIGERIGRMFTDVLSQKTLHRRDRGAGLAHTGIFYGYLIRRHRDDALLHSSSIFLKPLVRHHLRQGVVSIW